MDKLTIAIDYDDTYTADVKLWATFIRSALDLGHRVYCVTARRVDEESLDQINTSFRHWDCMIPVIFTSMGSKLAAMKRRNIEVDIWIDDNPKAIIEGR